MGKPIRLYEVWKESKTRYVSTWRHTWNDFTPGEDLPKGQICATDPEKLVAWAAVGDNAPRTVLLHPDGSVRNFQNVKPGQRHGQVGSMKA
jgi:hypothetical protein